MKPVLTEYFTAEAAISPYRICKSGATDGSALMAAASTAAMFGVSDSLGAAGAGDRVDIFTFGTVEVEYGGTIARDALLTSDANGKAVAATPGAGVNAYIIGIARVSGVAGDIGEVQLSLGRIQG